MKKINGSKVLNIFLGLLISFLALFIVAMLARSLSTNVLPENSKVALFINDYVDMMTKKIDSVALRMRIKRNTVSQYQVDLINQSISDYVSYSMFKSANAASSYNPNLKATSTDIENYKSEYYKMTIENPYIKSMTLFNTDGEMLLNLYTSENKSWPLELDKKLISNLKIKGSLVLNASNENSFYVMQYLRNRDGEFVVATKNDYAYISDIAMYYQVADKTLYVNDSQNFVYNIPEGMASTSMEPVSSVIARYAYYKKQPSFVENNTGLSITLFGREYPNYFELIVLAITAFFIVVLQYMIRGGLYLFGQLTGLKRTSEGDISLPKSSVPMIDEDIINQELPQSIRYEDIDLSERKVVHKIDEDLLYKKEAENVDEDLLYTEKIERVEGINLSKIPRFSLDEKLKEYKKESSLEVYDDSENILYSTVEKHSTGFNETIHKDETEVVFEDEKIKNIEEKLVDNTYSEYTIKDNTYEGDYNKKLEEIDILKVEKSDESDASTNANASTDANTEDVFWAFDRMLASIVNKVESETRDSLNKKL